jgi:hypothetical protein
MYIVGCYVTYLLINLGKRPRPEPSRDLAFSNPAARA